MDNKRMPFFAFAAAFFFGACFDTFSIIPFIGNFLSDLFIAFAWLTFWIAGYRAKGTGMLTAGTALVEMIPGFSFLPGCIGFVVGFYRINRKNTEEKAVLVA